MTITDAQWTVLAEAAWETRANARLIGKTAVGAAVWSGRGWIYTAATSSTSSVPTTYTPKSTPSPR